jgi:hypothetical protein
MVATFLEICGAISVVAAALAIIFQAYRYFRPANASISYTISAIKENSDSLAVTITNRSSQPIYIESCIVRSTYSMSEIIKRHLRRPLLRPSFYPNLRYNSCIYQLIDGEPERLEPSQQITLSKSIYEHRLNALHGPLLIAFVKLTTGRIVKSEKMLCPPVWRMIGMRGKVNA